MTVLKLCRFFLSLAEVPAPAGGSSALVRSAGASQRSSVSRCFSLTGSSGGVGRKFRSAELPPNFRTSSGIVDLWLSNVQYGFRQIPELGRNLAGTSGHRKFRPSSAPSFVEQDNCRRRKFRPSWPVLPVEAGTSGHPGRNFRYK